MKVAKRQYPPAGDVEYGYPDYEYYGDSGKMFSWVVFTLPYIEEGNLANLFDMKRDILAQAGDPQATVLPVMLCPSDDSRDLYYVPPFPVFRGKRFAKGNYAAYVSPFHVELHPWFPGALVAGKTWKFKNIVDGPFAHADALRGPRSPSSGGPARSMGAALERLIALGFRHAPAR